MKNPSRSPSLSSRLFWLILLAVLCTALLQGSITFRTARENADQIFDYQMQQTALSLRTGFPSNAVKPPSKEFSEEKAGYFVQIWANGGMNLFDSGLGVALPHRENAGFSTVSVNNGLYRIYTLEGNDFTIQVAQDMQIRQNMAEQLALKALLPIGIMAPLLMLIVWWVIGSAMKPLQRIQMELASRQEVDLNAIQTDQVPQEILPLIEELNLLFKRLDQSFNAQKNFVADAAHELRSPLTALKLQVQNLQRLVTNTDAQQALARLNDGIERAARLIEQLLTLARLQAETASHRPMQITRLLPLLSQEIAELAHKAHTKTIDLGIKTSQEASINAYPEAINILLHNLLDNAIKYTPSGGTIDCSIQIHAGKTLLTIEDSGPGIPETYREEVFQRFFRLPGSSENGSGLGLSIVKAIAELHGATLDTKKSASLGGFDITVSVPAPTPSD